MRPILAETGRRSAGTSPGARRGACGAGGARAMLRCTPESTSACPHHVRNPLRHLGAACRRAPDPATGARATPIHLSTSFVFRDSEHAASLFNMERAGHVYSRISNPTVAVFEERVAALENGVGAIGVASGQAALHPGGHPDGSGLSYRRLQRAVRRLAQPAALHAAPLRHRDHLRQGARHRRLARGHPPGDPPAVRRDARQPRPGRARHPTLAQLGRSTRSRCWSTRPSPPLPAQALRPWRRPALPFGHQVPGGHGTTIGGVLVEGGTFDFQASGRFPELSEPYEGFHNMVFTEESTVAPLPARAARACATSAPA